MITLSFDGGEVAITFNADASENEAILDCLKERGSSEEGTIRCPATPETLGLLRLLIEKKASNLFAP